MKDIDVKSRDKTGSTSLHLAATEGHVEIVEL
jgi:ankyrin repeat protein